MEEFKHGDSLTEGKVFIQFHADWCKPCQAMKPIAAEVAEAKPVRGVSINAGRHGEVSMSFDVKAVPTFVYVIDGQEVGRLTGKQTKAALLELLDATLAS